MELTWHPPPRVELLTLIPRADADEFLVNRGATLAALTDSRPGPGHTVAYNSFAIFRGSK